MFLVVLVSPCFNRAKKPIFSVFSSSFTSVSEKEAVSSSARSVCNSCNCSISSFTSICSSSSVYSSLIFSERRHVLVFLQSLLPLLFQRNCNSLLAYFHCSFAPATCLARCFLLFYFFLTFLQNFFFFSSSVFQIRTIF